MKVVESLRSDDGFVNLLALFSRKWMSYRCMWRCSCGGDSNSCQPTSDIAERGREREREREA